MTLSAEDRAYWEQNRDAIAAWLEGKPVQCRACRACRDNKPGEVWADIGNPFWNFSHADYRRKPEPEMVALDGPEGLPLLFCIRHKEARDMRYIPTGIFQDGIATTFRGSGYFHRWDTLAQHWEYSNAHDARLPLAGAEWLPFTKPSP